MVVQDESEAQQGHPSRSTLLLKTLSIVIVLLPSSSSDDALSLRLMVIGYYSEHIRAMHSWR